jgi:hypothetical protein
MPSARHRRDDCATFNNQSFSLTFAGQLAVNRREQAAVGLSQAVGRNPKAPAWPPR